MAQPMRSWHDLEAPFIQGGTQDAAEPLGNLPLGRFFPPYVPGRAAAWLNRYCAPGNWVLDPFGLDPYSVLELAQAGYRTAVTTPARKTGMKPFYCSLTLSLVTEHVWRIISNPFTGSPAQIQNVRLATSPDKRV